MSCHEKNACDDSRKMLSERHHQEDTFGETACLQCRTAVTWDTQMIRHLCASVPNFLTGPEASTNQTPVLQLSNMTIRNEIIDLCLSKLCHSHSSSIVTLSPEKMSFFVAPSTSQSTGWWVGQWGKAAEVS